MILFFEGSTKNMIAVGTTEKLFRKKILKNLSGFSENAILIKQR